ncbi:hypothetical protein Bca52824_061654 [Brassica carinata]|uniref:FAD-binding FR-type domain-containing protein n=1 Tax=Brassica carinata TaxID=52824 RepID=A0A8X7R5U7_BRACI|nr:hypothetical protein Bca52824_061654 [Brassica carinata]
MDHKSARVSAKTPSSGDEFKDVIKGLIKLLMLVIFLGYVFIWILMPTLNYRTKWLPVMRTEFGFSTYFGLAGLTLFMLMFPMLLLACLGCLYLHLKKQKTNNHLIREKATGGGVLAAMRRPMLVKGPLGIVSATELIFLAMFVALLLWNFFIYLRNFCRECKLHQLVDSSIESYLLLPIYYGYSLYFKTFLHIHDPVWLLELTFHIEPFLIKYLCTHLTQRESVVDRILHISFNMHTLFVSSRDLSPKLMYNPTSTLFVNIPCISKLQWHPFTITSSSNLEPEMLSIVIKSEGKWSTKLYKMLSTWDHDTDRTLSVSVEGPYGPVSTDFLRQINNCLHDALVMVSGGSGITPFISIIRDLIAMSQTTTTCETPKITLVCAFRKASDIAMLDLILPSSGLKLSSDLNIQIEAFITKDNEPSDEETQKIRTLWFKPSPSDRPISAILGPNSWLWLAAILSSSFIIFLIAVGIMTRYYIYPIDQNKSKYNAASRSILYLLVLCVSIMMTSSAAVLWNKKKYKVEGSKQVENVDVPSPTSSPSSWTDREIESTPQESLVQCTNLHFGERPDLKKILLDTKGSSVGVMVCGPKKMRQEVANICSSGLAENLHFESISFSW